MIEIMLASVLGIVILLGLAHVDVARILVGRDADSMADVQAEPSVALAHIVRTMQQADRVDVNLPDVQIRIPPEDPTALDVPTSYRWVQYHYDENDDGDGELNNEIRYYTPTDNPTALCTVVTRFRGIDLMNIQLIAPNTNTFDVTVSSIPDRENLNADGTNRDYTYRGQAMLRIGGIGDAALGNGLLSDEPDVNGDMPGDPPALCS